MKKNLVIVESPAKAKTIEKFLGDDYVVQSSYGHIRDLKKKNFSIDTESFEPEYEIPSDKQKVVQSLKKMASEAETVWLASDEDREGEAISWHLAQVLGLDEKNTKRIVFHEITKNAILEAIQHPRCIDRNLVNAQQARRVLDRIVGFKLSPILWRKVKPALSAGRVQSVAVRLVVEREREIINFKGDDSYRVTASLYTDDGNEIKAELTHRFATKHKAEAFLETCKDADLRVSEIVSKPTKRVPAPPFTTSTLQQEAAHKLGLSVAQTMMIAQRLYENGLITYMRTDSVNLSTLCLGACKQQITESMGKEYVKTRNYHTSSKGAQEAHEAIRPTYMDRVKIQGTSQERRLYELIWKRTIASQMADAKMERTVITIVNQKNKNDKYAFTAAGEIIKFDGFLKVYQTTNDNENNDESNDNHILPPVQEGQGLQVNEIVATQRFAQRPLRYNEASLVKKLEELGIGRPSTYATTITTIQDREYVVRGDKPGESVQYCTLTLNGNNILDEEKTTTIGAERSKLLPTDTGIVVNDFLEESFPEIMDYNFTADVEKEFDDIAEGKSEWTKVIRSFYQDFEPKVEQSLNTYNVHRVGERVLGNDPKTGEPVTVKIGRFGPVVQIGSTENEQKPRFAQLKAEQSLETITLEEALELFRLPRELGEFDGNIVKIGAGKYGPYINIGKMYISIPKEMDPMKISLEKAVQMILQQRLENAKKHLKSFPDDKDLEVLDGRYGPYIVYKKANYKLPKTMHDRAEELTYEECMEIVNNAPAPTQKKKKK
ncbi:MAG: type I DNA topoisomerase [Bacteroidaceae bacterium]|jgi:DNA topoisomerase-1|nr:type I DNA topoisomerase [Bacteroidaceae bacterium]MBR6845895.1 type I DNA topoisomerase [Bacteroidaceae bacterium]